MKRFGWRGVGWTVLALNGLSGAISAALLGWSWWLVLFDWVAMVVFGYEALSRLPFMHGRHAR